MTPLLLALLVAPAFVAPAQAEPDAAATDTTAPAAALTAPASAASAAPAPAGAPAEAPPPPTALLTWQGGAARVDVAAPPGWHFAAEAEYRLVWGRPGPGAFDPDALPFEFSDHPDPTVPGIVTRIGLDPGPVRAQVDVAVCEDRGSACVQHVLRLEGEVTGRKGALPFELFVPTPPPAQAGKAVRLYDFTAVWCPPCNLLAAEVLHDPEDAAALAPFELVALDVDRPDSWALKTRYAVGGYPTLVAVDAEGREVDRIVGYPGEAPTLAWLAGLGSVRPLHELLEGPVGGSPAEAGTNARRLAEGEYEEAARRWLAVADEGVDTHVARLLLDARESDARWLLENAPPGDWMYAALDAAPAAWPAALGLASRLPPETAASIYGVIADQLEGDAARALRSASVALLRSAMDGDPDHDRGYVVELADLMVAAGDLPGALTLLDENAARWPDEFTFHHAKARVLLDAGRPADAEAAARLALSKAWGDQRLRAVQVLAKALRAQGRAPEGLAALDAELATATKPGGDVAVRTTRYLAQVEALRTELAAGK